MPSTNVRSTTFDSKRDGWLVSVLATTMALEVIAAVALAIAGPPVLWLRVFVPVLLALSAVIIAWCLFGTSYRILDGELVVRSGPFRSRVPIAAITSVTGTQNAIAAPALSSDRLEVRCGQSGRVVLVSPREPTAFIAALQRVKATIAVTGEVPSRA